MLKEGSDLFSLSHQGRALLGFPGIIEVFADLLAGLEMNLIEVTELGDRELSLFFEEFFSDVANGDGMGAFVDGLEADAIEFLKMAEVLLAQGPCGDELLFLRSDPFGAGMEFEVDAPAATESLD